MIDKLVLLPELFFIFRLEIFPAALQHLIIYVICVLYARKSVRRIFSVKSIPRYRTLIRKLFFLSGELVKTGSYRLAVSCFRPSCDLGGHLFGQLLILHKTCGKLVKSCLQIPDIPLCRLDHSAKTDLFFLDLPSHCFLLCHRRLKTVLLIFQLRRTRSVLQLPQLFLQSLLPLVVFLQLICR